MADVLMSDKAGADAPSEMESVSKKADEPKDEDESKVDEKEITDYFKGRIRSAETNRRKFSSEWKRNVELRLGRPATLYVGSVGIDDEIQTELNPDWALTKTKTANLFSQVPEVQGTHENKKYAAAIPPFIRSLNYEIGDKRSCIGDAMEECLNDVVNASGVCGVLAGYAARFETVDIPAINTQQIPPEILSTLQPTPIPEGTQLTPELLTQMLQAHLLPMSSVERPVSDKFFTTRISPVDLLWPAEFTGSNFNQADWIGYTGRCSWSEALHQFKLTSEQKREALAGFDNPTEDDLRSDPEQKGLKDLKVVKFHRLFYWRYKVDPEEKSFDAIWELVFVHGITKHVKHEAWSGQKQNEQTRKYIGAKKFPLQILTLTYITDNPVPPSDSSAGRPQVNDMRLSRSQMFQNRERSIPVRWFDVNKLDPEIQQTLMRGTVQGMIPVNGDGNRSIGEIARASYPTENLTFDQQAKMDLQELWQVDPLPQAGGKKTSAEVQVNQQKFSVRMGQERARVASFFLNICEVIAGLMTLYSDFPILTEQERTAMQQAWDEKTINQDLVLKIRPDSAIVLDSQARIQRLSQFLNLTAKSGFVNVMPIIQEMAELSGLDPAEVVVQPKPKVDEANVSLRLSGKEDLINPLALAMLVKKGQHPSPQDLETAKQLLLSSQQPAQPQPSPSAAGAPPSAPAGGPAGAPGLPPPGPGAPAGVPQGSEQEMAAHPEWSLNDRIMKRSRDINS